MPDLYQKRKVDNSPSAQQEARRAMQKNQLKIIEEDGKLRRFERDLETKKKDMERARKDIEKYEIEIVNLQKKESDAQKEISTIERSISLQKSAIKKLEYDAEKFREAVYRQERSSEN